MTPTIGAGTIQVGPIQAGTVPVEGGHIAYELWRGRSPDRRSQVVSRPRP